MSYLQHSQTQHLLMLMHAVQKSISQDKFDSSICGMGKETEEFPFLL